MAASFGVYFGNTTACIALANEDKVEVLTNEAGQRVTPCIVEYTDHDQVVGYAAKMDLIRNSQNIVCNVKQLIGRQFDNVEVSKYLEENRVTIQKSKTGNEITFSVQYQDQQNSIQLQDIILAIFRKLIDTASRQGDTSSFDTVLTVPIDFTQTQIHIFTSAAERAGMNVLRTIHEPSAALLAYDIGQETTCIKDNVLVVRVGGTSTSVCIVSVLNGLYRVLAHITIPVGGHQYTRRIVDQLSTDFKRKYGHDVTENQRAMLKLKMAAENGKHGLTHQENVHVPIDSLHDGIDMDAKISRMRFNNDVSALVHKCKEMIQSVIDKVNVADGSIFTKDDITKVILCGGGSNVRVLQTSIQDFLPTAQILSSIPPDEVMAIGAAKQASILSSYDKEEILKHEQMNHIDCLSDMLYYSVLNCTSDSPLNDILFHRFMPLPVRKRHSYIITDPSSPFTLLISNNPVDVTHSNCAKLSLDDLPSPATVQVTYSLNREGSLHISAVEKTTNKEATLVIEVQEARES